MNHMYKPPIGVQLKLQNLQTRQPLKGVFMADTNLLWLLVQSHGSSNMFLSFLDGPTLWKLQRINLAFHAYPEWFSIAAPLLTWSNIIVRNMSYRMERIRTLHYTPVPAENPTLFPVMLSSTSSLTSLTMHKFNCPLLVGTLPPTLTILRLGTVFNYPLLLDVLPQGLLELDLGDSFNHPVAHGVFRHGLIKVRFGTSFNQWIQPYTFPSTLEELRFGEMFRHPLLENILPENLKTLFIDCFVYGERYNEPIVLSPHQRTEIYLQEPSMFEDVYFSSEESDYEYMMIE